MARILVIEDNAANLELISYLLQAFGHEVLSAGDGPAGITLAEQARPALILCDIQLPTMSGYEIAQILKGNEALQTIPLVAVTALAMVGDREHILAAGFDGYLEKPIVPETFVKQIEGFLPTDDRASAELQGATAEPPVEPDSAHPQGVTILVVDDHQINTELLRSILSPSGYRVIEFNSVAATIEHARIERPALIVSDLHMPGLSGFDLLRLLRVDPDLRDVKVIIHSATTQRESDRLKANELGATVYLTGPLDPEAFLLTVLYLLADDDPPQQQGNSAERL